MSQFADLSAAEIKGRSYTLSEILDVAQDKNPSLAVFQANLEFAKGMLKVAKAYPNPELNSDLGKGRESGQTGSGYKREYTLGLSQIFEWPGKRLYRRKAAEAEVGISGEELDDFRLELMSQVKEAFFSLLLSERILEISRKNLETAQGLVNSVRLRVTLGEAPELEIIKAEVELLKVMKDLKRAENRVIITRVVLNTILGGALEEGYEIVGDLSLKGKRYELNPLIERALIRHPKFLRQERALEAAVYALSQEMQAIIPDITLNGSVSDEIDKRSYAIGLSIPLPLFYQRQGEVAAAHARRIRETAELERTRLELTRLIKEEFQNYQIALDQIDVFEEGLLKQADEALRIARFSYEQGESDLLDLLDAQRVQRATFTEYLESQFELQSALARLERVTGGLP